MQLNKPSVSRISGIWLALVVARIDRIRVPHPYPLGLRIGRVRESLFRPIDLRPL